MQILNRLLWRLQYEKSKRISLENISVFGGRDGVATFYRFDSHLAEKTTTRLEPLHRLRMWEIDRAVRLYDVKSVLEMGSGRTTYFFNLYPELNVVSYEQDEHWRDVVLAFYRDLGRKPPRIVLSNVERYKKGGRFEMLQDMSCDLLYIDGPYVNRTAGSPSAPTEKPAYYDFERVLEARLPKVIMVEGRTSTVDELLKSSHAARYDFQGELTWALQRSRYMHALGLSRHSIFIRKQ